MKRGKLRKQGKQKISVIQRQLWDLCKKIVRKKYPNVCYTCSQTGLGGANYQTGHVPWPKASLGAYLKYDLRILRPQCARCNLWLNGMGAEAYTRMLKEIGVKKMLELQKDRQVTVKALDWYLKLTEDYQNLLKELEK